MSGGGSYLNTIFKSNAPALATSAIASWVLDAELRAEKRLGLSYAAMLGARYLAIQEVNAIEEMSAGQIENIAGQVLRTTDREHPLSVGRPPSYERHLENSKTIAASTCWPLVNLMDGGRTRPVDRR